MLQNTYTIEYYACLTLASFLHSSVQTKSNSEQKIVYLSTIGTRSQEKGKCKKLYKKRHYFEINFTHIDSRLLIFSRICLQMSASYDKIATLCLICILQLIWMLFIWNFRSIYGRVNATAEQLQQLVRHTDVVGHELAILSKWHSSISACSLGKKEIEGSLVSSSVWQMTQNCFSSLPS